MANFRLFFGNVTAAAGAYTLTAEAGSYGVSGSAAALDYGRTIAAGVGNYAISGTAANLQMGRRIVAGDGAYSLTGSAAQLELGRHLAAAAGSYSWTGTAADLIYGPAGGYSIVAAGGVFTLSGTAATLRATRRLAAAAGSYVVVGANAGLSIVVIATGCWDTNEQSFVSALANSAQFQVLVGVATSAAALEKIFRDEWLTPQASGTAWTREELDALRAYGQVFSRQYGQHVDPATAYLPHGTIVVAVGRLVPEADLVAKTDNRNGLTDLHDRQWQNRAGQIADEVLAWLRENGGPWPVGGCEVTADFETAAAESATQGVWQATEFSFAYREGG